jgi:hypothetical protein
MLPKCNGRLGGQNFTLPSYALAPNNTGIVRSQFQLEVMMIHKPATDVERNLYDALVLLFSDRSVVPISTQQFLALCKAAPDYALRMIESNRTELMHEAGHVQSKIAPMVMTAEWELKGASTFIEDHKLGVENEYTRFIEQKLKARPDEFSSADLETILSNFRHNDLSIRQAAKDALAKRVTTAANKLAADSR